MDDLSERGDQMKSIIIGMLAETAVHPGAGRSTGFVDLPVARESITEYPVIVGSSLKGALKDRAREKWPGKKAEKKTKKFRVQKWKKPSANRMELEIW